MMNSKRRFNLRRLFLVAAMLIAGLSAAAIVPAQQTKAQGGLSMGIRETNAQIMARQAAMGATIKNNPPRAKFEHESEMQLKDNPNAPHVAQIPAAPSDFTQRPLLPQTLGLTFTGATFNGSQGFVPPDTMGAVGPTQYLIEENGIITTFNKTTGVADGVLNAFSDIFWASVRTSSASDPQVRYDRTSGRFFATAIDVSTPNRVMIAVSQGPTMGPQSTWTFFQFDQSLAPPAGDGGCLFDYPTTGIDVNALYIGGTQFCPGEQGGVAFVVQKSSVLGNGPIVVNAFRALSTPGGGGIFTPRGVDSWDPVRTFGYFIGPDYLTNGTIRLLRITNPGSASPTSSVITVAVPNYFAPTPVDFVGNNHPGGAFNGFLDASDTRFMPSLIRNGHLWASHGTLTDAGCVGSAAGTRDATQWFEFTSIDTAAPTILQNGTICDTAATNPEFYTYGTMNVSGQDHVVVGMTAVNSVTRPDAADSGRLATDAAGTMAVVTRYTASSANYTSFDNGTGRPRRWGDYSMVTLDPCDDMTLYPVEEYVDATASWGVKVAQMKAPLPAAMPGGAFTPGSVATGLFSQTVAVVGTPTAGAGFYDTPASMSNELCRKRITASITNGVTVNSVTYTDPTHISLNISTVGATTGAATVTVTNPDGQTSTGTITITAGVPPVGTATNTNTPTLTLTLTPTRTLTPSSTPAVGIVTNLNDSGAGSLRQVVGSVCPNGVVNFQTGLTGTITLTTGEIPIPCSMIINGPGSRILSVSGGGASRIFNIAPGATGNVTINGLSLINGNATTGTGGGAITVNAGVLNLNNLSIRNNNSNGLVGGGLDNEGANVTIIGTTISGNSGTFRGGGIQNQTGGQMTIINSTITGNNITNAGGSRGGGIRTFVPLTIINTTITNNTASLGGNIAVGNGTPNLQNSIVAGGTATTNPDIDTGATAVNSLDYNLIQTVGTAVITGTTTNNITGMAPNLGALANNGGQTDTQLPNAGSPVIDKIPASNCASIGITTDQRGFARPVNVLCDIGSVEAGAVLPSPTPTSTSTSTPTSSPTPTSTPSGAFCTGPMGGANPGALPNDTIGLYDPPDSFFYLKNSNSAGAQDFLFQFGPAPSSLKPISGDWINQGKTTVGLFDPGTSTFYLKLHNSGGVSDYAYQFTPVVTGRIPLSGDWIGTGVKDGGEYDSTTGTFYLRNSNSPGGADTTFAYGPGGTDLVPLAGDWFGLGHDTVGLYSLSNACFYLKHDNAAGTSVLDYQFQYGPGHGLGIPVVGHWVGGTQTSVGVYVPANAFWYLKNTNAAGNADTQFQYGPGPNSGWLPVIGHWGMPGTVGTPPTDVPTRITGSLGFVSNRDGQWGIYKLNGDDTHTTRLASIGNNPVESRPAWSADGKQVAFVSAQSGNPEIYTMTADGGNIKRLTYTKALNYQPTWSADGKQIAFVSNRDNTINIYVMNSDGSNVQQITHGMGIASEEPAWSPDGKLIAYATGTGTLNIAVMNDTGSKSQRLTTNGRDPVWSPDGTQIAFASTRDGGAQIYVMNADGSNVRRLTNSSAQDEMPTWSPDGTQIAFASTRDGRSQIYVINANGSNDAQRVSNSLGQDKLPVWLK